ncbi:MAG: NAD(P)-dependent alcohol dehydrogenase [Bacteroidota bacterium]
MHRDEMTAVVHDRYGPPDVLRLDQVPVPDPAPGEVRVRIRAASVNAGDWHMMRADPFFIRLVYGGLLRPRHPILGSDVAGCVDALGSGVATHALGDAVFGDLSSHGFGAFAEYVCAPAEALVGIPENVTPEEAAAVPVAALAALQGLRDVGGVQAGHRVLVNGASGGVGTFAVQLARHLGAHVTGVCSTRNVELVRSLGADRVVDYTEADVTQQPERYDVVLDAAAFRSPLAFRSTLTPTGVYVLVGGSTARLLQAAVLSLGGRRQGMRIKVLTSASNPADLSVLRDLLAAGAIAAAVGQTYPLAGVPDAIRRLEHRRASGKVVITV